jgi:DNA repair ATPase RecN
VAAGKAFKMEDSYLEVCSINFRFAAINSRSILINSRSNQLTQDFEKVAKSVAKETDEPEAEDPNMQKLQESQFHILESLEQLHDLVSNSSDSSGSLGDAIGAHHLKNIEASVEALLEESHMIKQDVQELKANMEKLMQYIPNLADGQSVLTKISDKLGEMHQYASEVHASVEELKARDGTMSQPGQVMIGGYSVTFFAFSFVLLLAVCALGYVCSLSARREERRKKFI